MGMMDNYKPDAGNTGYAEGVRRLAIESIETKFTTEGKEVKNFTFVSTTDQTKKMYKRIYDDDFAARKITAIVSIVGLDPKDLFMACSNGTGDNWMQTKLVGRSGDFDCRKGRPKKDGKQYLEPMTPSEIEYIEWRKLHQKNGAPVNNEPPIDSYQSAGFPDDVPY